MPSRTAPSIVIGPSAAHQTSDSSKASTAVFRRTGSRKTGPRSPVQTISGCSGSRRWSSAIDGHELADVAPVGVGLERAAGDPRRVDEQVQDLVHPIGVVDDPGEHQAPLLVGHVGPALLERVAEALHRREGRPDVVGGRGDRASRGTPPCHRRRRACSNRQIVAAAARLSDSAAPACGTRTVASASGDDLLRQPVRLVAEHEGDRAAHVGRVQRVRTVRVHREDPVPARPQRLDRGDRRDVADDRQMEDRPGGRAHGLRVVDVDRGGRRTRRRRAPAASADRTIVPAFPGSRTSCRTATHPAAGTRSRPTSTNGRHADDPLRRDGGGQPRHDGAPPRARPRPRAPGRATASSCSSSSTNNDVDRRRVRRERLAHALRALDEEPAIRRRGTRASAAGRPARPSGSWCWRSRHAPGLRTAGV